MYSNEKSDTQKFWLKLLRDVFGIINPEDYVDFEKRVKDGHTKFIDAYIPSTGIIIEQKSAGKNLDEAFIQAKNYYDWLPFSQRGRYILTCDFNVIHVHDMEEPTMPPVIIPVNQADKSNLAFLIVPGEIRPLEEKISVEAGEKVKTLYEHMLIPIEDRKNERIQSINKGEKKYSDAQKKMMIEEINEKYRKERDEINVFCVRLVFILYAEDAGLFRKSQFHDYLKPRSSMARDALRNLFAILKTPEPERDAYIDPALKDFPYVNGGLFKDDVNFPYLDEEAVNIIISDMSEKFNWKGISPTIFGAVFESTLNDDTRKQAGIHYTSTENIHKVIDPLFLDGLKNELNEILSESQSYGRTQKLIAFQDKLSKLKFLDPACGSGNFLTESFIHLRRMENKLLAAVPENERPDVKVSITQFHGIEVHNFAVNIARTALWISDHQMWEETQIIMKSKKAPLPLVDYHHIKEGSAMDELPNEGWMLGGWNIPHEDMLYIMGNPPFIGRAKQNKGQKESVRGMGAGQKR